MPILVAAVVIATLLGLVNLLLGLAVIRRLREHTARLAALSQDGSGGPEPHLLAPGTPLPEFTGHTADGAEVSGATLRPGLVAFMSTTCGACTDQLPALRRYLTDRGGSRETALVLVVGERADAAWQQLVDELSPVATVVTEPHDGPVSRAFDARAFPTFYQVDAGVVRAGAYAVERLPAPVPA